MNKEIKEKWKNLNAAIIKIRESWAEDSDYCQDEIMERFEKYLEEALAEKIKEIVPERKHEGQLDPILLLERSQSLKDALLEQVGWNACRQTILEKLNPQPKKE